MAHPSRSVDPDHIDALRRHYQIRLDADTLTSRPLVMEVVLTAILVSVILNTATGHRSIGHNAATAVGATVAPLGLFASPVSGASMNPARTLGPDIVSGRFTGW
jgi:glycerol uptake facilitator-like aquaporin